MSTPRPRLVINPDTLLRIPGLHKPLRKQGRRGVPTGEIEIRDKKPRGKPFPKGVSGNPTGLPKNGKKAPGHISARKQLFEQRRKVIAESGLTPLEFLLSVVRDPKAHMDYRIDASKAAAPYVHRKMPIAIEGGDPSKPVVFEASALTMLSSADKLLLLALVEKMTLGMQKPLQQRIIEGTARRESEREDEENEKSTK